MQTTNNKRYFQSFINLLIYSSVFTMTLAVWSNEASLAFHVFLF